MASTINASTSAGLISTGDTSGVLALQTNSGTTAVTIDTSQNVLVGTTTTTNNIRLNQKVAVVTTGSGVYGGISNTSYNGTSAGVGPIVDFQRSRGTTDGSMTAVASGDTLGYMVFRGADGTQFIDASYITGQVDGSVTAGTVPGRLVFNTSGAERMRIDSSGYVGIGTSSPSSYGALAVRKGVSGTWLGVVSNCSFETSDAATSSIYMMHSSANSGSAFICSDAGGRLQMFCSSSATGGVYLGNGATSWASASDERVKENLVPIENGLTKVASLRTFTGNYINDPDKKSRAFLIAQDVEAVLPEAVDHSNPDELGLSYTDVIPLLVASIKELKAINDQQAETINALTARVVALEQKGTV